MKKILVTGGAGFIGSDLIRYLMDETEYKVLNLDKLTYAGNLESISGADKSENYSFAQVDICDKEAVFKVVKDFQPDAIMHLAAESHVDRSIDGPEEFLRTNIMGTFNLLEAARSLGNPDFKFHHISTDEVYGDLDGPDSLFTEETPYSPSSPYSASKAGSDHLVRAWARTFGLKVLITNCSNNYGPYQFPEKLIPHMILNAISGKSLPVYGDGQQVRDWLYVRDHVKALTTVLEKGVIGETYNIGGFNEQTNLHVVHTICDILEKHASNMKPEGVANYKDLITYVKDRPGHDRRYAIDSNKIKRELGWTPDETFETGLEKTVLWYLENKTWWERVLSGEYKLDRIGTN